MRKNILLEERFKTVYNREENYNNICLKIENLNNKKRKIFNIVITLFIITIFTTVPSIYAKRNWKKEYENESREYINSIIDLNMEKEKNVKNIDMNYIYKDNIGIKLNKVSISEYCCQIDISFDNSKIEENTFNFGYAIYDENNNVYWVEERPKYGIGKYLNYSQKLYKELGINKKTEYLAKSAGTERNLQEEETIVRLSLYSINGFNQTSKLYIRVFDIGYTLKDEVLKNNLVIIKDAEDFVLSNEEWQFDVEIPNEYYKLNHKDLSLSTNVDNLKIKNITLSTENYLSMDMETNYTDIELFDKITVSDENGKIYRLFEFGKLDNGDIRAIFHIDEESIKMKIYLNIEIEKDNINKKIELLKK